MHNAPAQRKVHRSLHTFSQVCTADSEAGTNVENANLPTETYRILALPNLRKDIRIHRRTPHLVAYD